MERNIRTKFVEINVAYVLLPTAALRRNAENPARTVVAVTCIVRVLGTVGQPYGAPSSYFVFSETAIFRSFLNMSFSSFFIVVFVIVHLLLNFLKHHIIRIIIVQQTPQIGFVSCDAEIVRQDTFL